MNEVFDCEGWATRFNVKCSDGRIISPEAFRGQDGAKVPIMWNHRHDSPDYCIGHGYLSHRAEGMWIQAVFNDSRLGRAANNLVHSDDVDAFSICANKLKSDGPLVLDGLIREVSLCVAGANPKAYIENVMNHGELVGDEAIIYTGEKPEIYHSDSEKEEPEVAEEKKNETPENDEKAVQEVIDSMTDKQKNVMYALIGQALEGTDEDDSEENEEDTMKHNAFDNNTPVADQTVLTHADQAEILRIARSEGVGSLRSAMQIFADEHGLEHSEVDISGFAQTGNGSISSMFPETYTEAHPSRAPELITNDMGWVDAIMAKTQKIPHGRVRTSHIDIRNIDSLKAKGYKKGDKKRLTGNYNLARRTADPQTVYVTSELHRDDVLDIEDFDYVAFQYGIDQASLKETLAVATMLGDERDDSDPEKIFPEHIRPIWTDDELYTIHKDVDFNAMAKELQGNNSTDYFGENFIKAEAMVNTLRMARKEFRGTGKPDMFVTVDMHNTMILARDRNGHRLYHTDTELAAALGVNNIYEVVQFEDKERTDENQKKHKLLAICVNMADYGYGCSKGGDVTHFTDFDIKFNKLQSLLETRKSGQLTRIKSAIALEEAVED